MSAKSDEGPGTAETGPTSTSPTSMATRVANRPSTLKLEKRSSMSQLLSQIKDRLPGRKGKGKLCIYVVFSSAPISMLDAHCGFTSI